MCSDKKQIYCSLSEKGIVRYDENNSNRRNLVTVFGEVL